MRPMAGSATHHCSAAYLQTVASQLFQASLSPSTVTSYERMFQRYVDFCNMQFKNMPLFPSTQDMVSQFVASLFVDNLSPSTIASYISAISFAHKCRDAPDPTSSFVIKKILKGIQNTKGKLDSRLPITGAILIKILNATSHVVSNRFHQSLLRAMFLLAFHAFLRIGEITTRRPTDSDKVLQSHDVSWQRDHGSVTGISVSMTLYKHSNMHPKTIFIPVTNGPFCPVASLSAYLTRSGHCDGPLFQFPCGAAIPHAYCSSTLKSILIFIGLDPQFYKGHSFRIGAATAAAARGVPMSIIQNMGRWKSDAFKHYIRMQNFRL